MGGSTWSGRAGECSRIGILPGVRDLWVKAHQASVERILAKAQAELGNVGQVMVFPGHLCLFGYQRTWPTRVSISLGSGDLRTQAQTTKFHLQFQAGGKELWNGRAQGPGVGVFLGDLSSYPSWERNSELLGSTGATFPAPLLSPPSAPEKTAQSRLT